MDPDERRFYMPDGRRLTAVRVAGFALELALQWIDSVGLFGLRLAPALD